MAVLPQTIAFDYQTVDATPILATSIEAPESSCQNLILEFSCCDPAFTVGAVGTFKGMLLRGPSATSTPVRFGGSTNAFTSLSAPQPSLTFTVNATTKNLDIIVTGKTGLILNWHVELTIIRHTT